LSVPLHHAINPVNELRVIDSCPKEIHLRGHWQGAHHANPAPFGGVRGVMWKLLPFREAPPCGRLASKRFG